MSIVSFDECSVLKLCKITIPEAYKIIFGKEELFPKNHKKVHSLVNKIKKQGLKPYRFEPASNLSQHALKVGTACIEQTRVNPQFLKIAFRKEVVDQLTEFTESLNDWEVIQKQEDRAPNVQEIFKQNEQELRKDKNIPELDDCSIIAGLLQEESQKKFLISEDEHFWGYKRIIQEEFNITIVPEWDCQNMKIES